MSSTGTSENSTCGREGRLSNTGITLLPPSSRSALPTPCKGLRAAQWGLFLRFRNHLHPQPLPTRAGLSHMSKEFEEELLLPCGEFHFASYGSIIGMSLQDVERDAANDGKILRH